MTTVVVIIIVVVVVLGGGLVVGRRRAGRSTRAALKAASERPSVTGPSVEHAEPDSSLEPEDRALPIAPVSSAVDVVAVSAPDTVDLVGAPPRLIDRLGRARALLADTLGTLGRRDVVDEQAFEQLEEALILADVGLPTTRRLLDDLRSGVRDGTIPAGADALISALRRDIVALFAGEDRSLVIGEDRPSVWLFVGVNGVGKTTTIGKLARRERSAGHSVVLAAGDTFRAAAGDQLAQWAERTGAGIVQGADGADPSSVVFDAIAHAAARGVDLVLADSAGRMHTKTNLMEELKKVRRVADRPPGHVTEVLLVIDATTGQNGLAQAREFAQAVDVTGVVLTKLDGTAKGGIVLAIRSEFGLPIKLVGLGEGVGDLVDFDPEEFATALIGPRDETGS